MKAEKQMSFLLEAVFFAGLWGALHSMACLVQISWETQANWLRTMQEDARIYRATSMVQSP